MDPRRLPALLLLVAVGACGGRLASIPEELGDAPPTASTAADASAAADAFVDADEDAARDGGSHDADSGEYMLVREDQLEPKNGRLIFVYCRDVKDIRVGGFCKYFGGEPTFTYSEPSTAPGIPYAGWACAGQGDPSVAASAYVTCRRP